MTTNRAAVLAIVKAMEDRNNNQPPQPGIFPDYSAPIVAVAEDGQREMRDAGAVRLTATCLRWTQPSPTPFDQAASVVHSARAAERLAL